MHAIIICDTPNFVGAGRQPLAAIHNLPDNYSKSSQIDCVDDAPVPAQKRVRTINRREGLAMLEGRKEGSSRSRGNRSFSGLAQAPSLKRVRTINQLEGLGMIERRNTLLAERESGSWAQASSLINFLKM